MDLDSFLVSLYVLVDDWWRERHPPSLRHKPGRPVLLGGSPYLNADRVLAGASRHESRTTSVVLARSCSTEASWPE